MSVELLVPAPERVISGIGPYSIPHPYEAETIVVVVIDGIERRILPSDAYTVTPDASTTTGDVYLTAPTAALYAGASLFIQRDTAEEQGWVGLLGERERGLEAQLDRMVMVDQELADMQSHTLRTDRELPPFVAVPGAIMMFDTNGNPASGPLANEVWSNLYDTGLFDILGGVLRQNPTDRTRWEFLNDTAHMPVGFDPDPNMLASDGITPLYPRSAAGLSDGARKILAFYKRNTDARRVDFSDAAFYDRIVSCIVTPDEVTASQWGLSIGARCTRSGIDIRGSMHKQRHARIYWDSSASTFVITEDSWHPAGNVTVAWDATAGILTVNHAWLPGNVLHLQADMRATDALPGGSVPAPFIPVQARIVSNTQFTMRFLGDGAGPGFTPRTGAASSGMSFRFTKSYHGELLFNGGNGFDSIDWSTADAGNLWCMILMRREAPLPVTP